MFGTYFYHQKIRKSVAAFGSLFTKLHVIRKDASGNVISTVKVPLAYAPRSKYIERIQGIQDIQRDEALALKLPRMSFEMTSLIYDEIRQLPKRNLQVIGTTDNSDEKRTKITPQVPYNITFSLTIYAKAQDDALQIVEQILPFFTPQYSLTMKPFATDYPVVVEDMPITLQSVAYLADYEGDLANRNIIQYVLDFEMKVSFTGPLADGDIIKKSIVEYEFERNKKDFKIEYTPDPLTIIADSDYNVNINYFDSA